MRIIVSGATGNTGVNVVKAISAAGHTAVAITRNPEAAVAQSLAKLPGVHVVRYEDAFKEPADRAYLAFHNLRDAFVDETEFILNARSAGVKYIVKLATCELWMQVYDKRHYARAHVGVEFFLEHGDIPFTSLRPNLFLNSIGADFASLPTAKAFKTLFQGANVAAIAASDVGAAAAALLLLDDPSPHYGKKYSLTGPEDLNAEKVKKTLEEVLGTPITYLGDYSIEEATYIFKSFGFTDRDVQGLLTGEYPFPSGLFDRTHSYTSPELLALAPPKTTFKQFLTEIYKK